MSAPVGSSLVQLAGRDAMYQVYTRSEMMADGAIHAVGIFGGIVSVFAMMWFAIATLPALATASLAVYGVGLIAMLACSAAYNMHSTSTWRTLLRRVDQTAIFLKIAGTYTPFAVVKMGGATGMALLASVWTVALLAGALKLFQHRSRDALDIALYLALGWAGLAALGPLSASLTAPVLALLAIGGGFYSIGVIFHVWNGLKYQNVIWHAFVLAGTCCHFGAVNIAVFG